MKIVKDGTVIECHAKRLKKSEKSKSDASSGTKVVISASDGTVLASEPATKVHTMPKKKKEEIKKESSRRLLKLEQFEKAAKKFLRDAKREDRKRKKNSGEKTPDSNGILFLYDDDVLPIIERQKEILELMRFSFKNSRASALSKGRVTYHFHMKGRENLILNEDSEGNLSSKLKKYTIMERSKLKKKYLSKENKISSFLIELSGGSVYRKISLQQYLKLTKILKVAVIADMFVVIDGMEEYREDGTTVVSPELAFSKNFGPFESINELLQFDMEIDQFLSGAEIPFLYMYGYDYLDIGLSVLVYDRKGELHFFKSYVEFAKEYGLLPSCGCMLSY